jgi:hypothetical protein
MDIWGVKGVEAEAELLSAIGMYIHIYVYLNYIYIYTYTYMYIYKYMYKKLGRITICNRYLAPNICDLDNRYLTVENRTKLIYYKRFPPNDRQK